VVVMRKKGRRRELFTGLALALLFTLSDCSSGTGPGGAPLLSNGDGSGGASGTGMAGTGYTGTGAYGGFPSTGGSSGGGIESGGTIESFDPDKVCAGTRVDPDPVEIQVETLVPYEVTVPQPIAIYVMQDHSGSMDDGTPSKWSIATDAINIFVNDPASEFINVAVQFFPLADPACDGAAYSTPAVPMGPLPDNAGAVTAAYGQPSQGLFTPIEPALRGMTSFCASFQQQNPDIKCVGVLISDGAPTACNLDPNILIGIAEGAYNNDNVMTFTVGMTGADFNLLNQVAMWGGSDCTPNDPNTYACDVTPGSGMTLLQAFESIREFVTTLEERVEYKTEITTKISECEWGIPPVPEGETFNKDMVNVVFSEPGVEDVSFGRVGGLESCVAGKGAWYYDDPENPTQVIACPDSCEYLKSVEGGVVNIQFGCETIILVE
jgi:hypothetical protein